MKIAQIAPLMESVPPRLYGGTERVVSYLTDELVHLGHDVTLFASGDSISSAKLVRCVPMALRLDANVRDPIPYYMLMLNRVRELANEVRCHGPAQPQLRALHGDLHGRDRRGASPIEEGQLADHPGCRGKFALACKSGLSWACWASEPRGG